MSKPTSLKQQESETFTDSCPALMYKSSVPLLVFSLNNGFLGIAELWYTRIPEFGLSEASLSLIHSNGCGSFPCERLLHKNIAKIRSFGLLFSSGWYQSHCSIGCSEPRCAAAAVQSGKKRSPGLSNCACCLSAATRSPAMPVAWLAWLSAVPRSRVPLSC